MTKKVVIRNFIFFIFFMILFYLLLIFVLTPSLKKYQKSKFEYTQNLITFNKVQNELNKKLVEFSYLTNETSSFMAFLHTKFDKNRIVDYINKYMTLISIKEIDNKKFNIFTKKVFLIKAKTNTPISLYKFIYHLDKNINIKYPIKFDYQDGNLYIAFRLEFFSINQK